MGVSDKGDLENVVHFWWGFKNMVENHCFSLQLSIVNINSNQAAVG